MLCCVALANQTFASSDFEETVSPNIPSTSYWGTRGLSQTVAAEPLGDGRFNMAVSGSYFNQEQEHIPALVNGTNVLTGRAALSFGLNSNMDLFGILPFYHYKSHGVTEGGVGGLVAGLQGALPLPPTMPLKLGAQFYLIYGFDEAKVTKHPDPEMYYAGYDYFDATGEKGLGVGFRLTQSLVGETQNAALKLHFNQGYFKSGDKDFDKGLLLLAAGLQIDPNPFLTIGIELNSRTSFESISFATDPLWLTPSVMFRSPVNVGFLLGIDLALSKKNDDGQKPLESYRLFGDMIFSFDLLASKRAEANQKRRDELKAKAELERQAQELAAQKESLAQRMVEDSIAAAQSTSQMAQRMQADSLAAAENAAQMAQRMQADSIAAAENAAQMAQRMQADSIRARAVADSLENLASSIAQQAAEAIRVRDEEARAQREADSIALADTKKRLDEEKARRTEAEQSFLSTGMLTLDNSVQFQSGKTDIPHNARPYLTILARMLAKYPKLKIEIGGHSDNIGGLQANMNLSQKRAESVFLFMVGVEPGLANSLSAKGYGPTVPKADNNTAAGRQINRRIELKVLNPEVLQEYNP